METVKFIKDDESPTTDRVANQPLNDLLCVCRELINSWETRAFEAEKAPKEYVRGISSGMKICIEELSKKVNYT